MTKLAMTKLAVRVLPAQSRFYEAVLGFEVLQTVEVPGLSEVIMGSSDGAGGTLVLVDKEGSMPAPGTTLLVFETEDIAGFVRRVEVEGGIITRPVERLDELGLSFAFFADPEGNAMEVIERA